MSAAPAPIAVLRFRTSQSKMLVMETESGKEEVSSLAKGIPAKEEGVLKESLEPETKVEELPEEEEERLLALEEEEEGLPDEVLESCVVREEVSEETSGTLCLIESELVEKEEVEEDLEELKEDKDILKEAESMLVELVAGHCVEGGGVVEEGAEIEDVSSKGDKQGAAKSGSKDPQEFGSEESGGDVEDVGKVKDVLKAGSPHKVAGQLGAKESSAEMPEKKKNSHSKETLSHPKIKKEPKEQLEELLKTPVSVSGEENLASDRGRDEAKVKVEPHEEAEESASKAGGKGDGDSSNPASDEYEEECQEDVAEETPEEESHGEKRSCMDDSGGGSSEESGGMCCKRRRVEGGEEGSSHQSSKDALLMGTEKEGGGPDESLDHKVERLKKEIHMLGVMAKQKEAEWDEIIRAKKVKEESLLRLQRRRRIAAIGREVALAERRRHRREGRRARTEADVTSEDEGTDEEWYMQIRGMTGGAHHPGSRMHSMGAAGQRTASGRTPLRNIPSTSSSFLLGMNSSSFAHSALTPSSTSSMPSVVSSTFTQRMHRPILPKPPMIPNAPVSRRNMVQNSNPVVTTSIANPLLPATIPTNGGLGSSSCNPLDNSQTANQIIGEGRQGPILDVRSIIADYRSRHPETVPLRGRRNKSLTPTPAAAMMSREGMSGGGGGSDGGPSDMSATPEGGMSSTNNNQGILNIASLALGSGSQVRTRGVQSQESPSSDIGYLLLSGNGCGQGGSLPIRQQQPARDSSRPSSTESSRSGGQAIPPVTLSAGSLVDGSGNFSFKDVLVQFARMSQSEQQQQMMTVIPGLSNQGLLSTASSLQSQLSGPGRQPRHILPSTTSSSVLPGPMVTPTRPPPPPYPEVTLLPVLVSGNEGSTLRPSIPTEIPMQRSSLPPPTPSLLQMSLSAPTTTPQVPSPPSTSLLHGILTKSGSGIGSSGLGSTPGGATPRATAFAPTLARLLTAPEKQPTLGPVRATPPATTGSSVLGSQAFVSIGELLSTSKAKNEITITPVSGAASQSSLLKPPQQAVSRSIKEEPATHMEEEQDDSTDRLVIDESAAAEADRRHAQAARQAPQPPPAMSQEVTQEPVEESIADEEVEEEEVAMEEEEGMEEEGAMEDEEEEGEEGPVPECQGCHSRAAQFVCAGCGNQWYCSRDCQVSAWDEHSEVCSG